MSYAPSPSDRAQPWAPSRRTFLKGASALAAASVLEPWRGLPGLAAGLPSPASAPFDHVVVLMLENRSWDHFLGWLPGADGRQAGLSYTDTAGNTYPTYRLARDGDFQGCGYADPDHSWEGGVKQLNGGKLDGFLKTATPGDTFPIGYYEAADLPVMAALAQQYTVSDNYFCSILAETYPNRFYQHAAQTDRDHNNTSTATMPAIWDRLTGGLTGRYYFHDLPFTALWGSKYASISRPIAQFLAECQAGTLPNVAFVDPSFNGETQGTSNDSHPHGDVRAGDALLAEVYHAVRNSPNWSRTILVVNFDEWGGFYDHVKPPRVIDDHVNPAPGPHPDYRQLGFRVPNIVISPFSPPGRVVSGGAPFEHTSVLKMIEWRWGLMPLTKRDANARNLAEMLDFSLNRTDNPAVASPVAPIAVACGPTSVAAHAPKPIGGPGAPPPGGPRGSGSAPSSAGGGLPGTAAGLPGAALAGLGGIALGTAAAGTALRASRRQSADDPDVTVAR